MVALVGGITAICLYLKSHNANNILENLTVEQAEKYYGQYPGLLPKVGKSKVMTVNELKNNGYTPEIGDCDGYVVITNKTGVSKYKAYLKCKNYTSEGFDEKKLEK